MVKVALKTVVHQLVCLNFGIFLICVPMTTCASTDIQTNQDVVINQGLKHTSQDQQIVEQAIERTNFFLKEKNIKLFLSLGTINQDNPQENTIPVYLVESTEDKMTTPALVPKGCRCIFVNPKVLASWSTHNSEGSGRMSIDRNYFLTYILLHESGHISKQTSSGAFNEGALNQLNIDPTKAKANEEDADEFAADLLRKYSRQTPANNVSLEANWVVNELSNLSWNMLAFRTLDEFGSFAIGKSSVYFDNGYSHPNMAWRILRVNNLIQRTEATKALLDSFEEARQRGANPEPLYQQK
jgi:hypothetical protein